MTSNTDEIIMDRHKQYGDYGDMSEVAQGIKDYLKEGVQWDNLEPGRAEALEMIATKMARLVCGDFRKKDTWLDIEGYAKLGLDTPDQFDYVVNTTSS